MYQIILLVVLSLVVIYLLYQNYVIQKEIYKIKNSFDELNNFLDLSIKKTKPKVLDTLSSIKTNDITDNIVTYSNDVKRVKVETTINSEEQLNMKNQYNLQKNEQVELKEINEDEEEEDIDEEEEDIDEEEEDEEEDTEELNEAFELEDDETSEDELENELEDDVLDKNNNAETGISNTLNNIKDAIRQELNLDEKVDEEKKIEIVEIVEDDNNDGDKNENQKNEDQKNEDQKNEGDNNEGDNNEGDKNEGEKNQYSVGKLQKLNVNAIKEIAKNLNIVLSMNGKQKTKEQFIKDILAKKNK
jgi:hypothetical protein